MRGIRQWALLLFLLIFGSGLGIAQSINSGDIRGTVTDESGAVLPDVKVTILNTSTGVAKELTTNHVGIYDSNSIVTGNYTVTFQRDGFQVFVRGPITLELGFTTVNAVMKVGSTSEQVVVNTDIPLLSTESGDHSSTFDAKSMDQLPQVSTSGPSWENFVILIPGATGTSSSNPGAQATINGNLPFSNVISDGASTTLGQSQNAQATTFEDIAEIQVNTSSFSAQYGVGGVIFNQVTKSGTKDYHGTAYEYVQNNALAAHSYNFNNGTADLPALHWHNFGGAIGGPVPKLKKAFFYFNYDHIIDNGSNGSLHMYTVPTEAMMSGDFSEISAPLYDPTSQTIAIDSNSNPYPVRQAFSGNIIPSAKLDSVAANFIKWYPTPSNHIAGGHFLCGASTSKTCDTGSHGEPINNFGSALSAPNPTIKYFGRFDYDVTPKHRLTLSNVQTDNNSISNPSGVEACPVGCQSADVENKIAQVSDVWTISSRMVNEARLGYTYQFNQFADQTFGKGLPAQLGWKFAKEDDFPDIDFEDGDWTPAWINKQGNNLYKEHVFDPSDVVTLMVGKHIMHFGGEVLVYRNDSFLWGGTHQSGTFGFGSVNYAANGRNYSANWNVDGTGTATIDTSTGWAMADFMLGYAANWSAQETPEFGARLKSPQMFFQDDYKITPTLTVNLGLRWQMNHGWNETHGNITSFDPNVANSDGTMGAMWYASTHANGRTALEADVKDVFLPRLGASWLLDAKTTLRGGWGIYAYNWSADNYGMGIGLPFGSSGSAQDSTGGITPIVKLDGDGTNFVTGAALPWVSNAATPDAYNGQGVNYTPYHTPVPKIMQWNVSVQREVAPNTSVEVSYVASHGYDLLWGAAGGVNFNQIPESELLSTQTNDAAIPYPNFNSIGGYASNATSNYNSLQAQISRRFSSGLSFNFNYVWSHMLDSLDSSGWGSHAGSLEYQNSYSPSQNYGASNFDQRNAFKGYAVYELPFGKGKMFLNGSRLMDEIVGGWQASGTIILSSGNPFTVTDSSEHQTNANGGGEFPNWGTVSWKPAHKSIQTWYNPEAFVRPADGTFGNVRRNSLYGPGLNVVNISAHKEFFLADAWKHEIKLQFRADASNAFNHPSFGQPNSDLTGSSGQGTAYTGTNAGSYQITSVTVDGRSLQLALRVSF